MKKFLFSCLSMTAAVVLLASCQDDWSEGRHGGKQPDSVVSFVISGNTASSTRAEARTVVAPSNVIDLPVEEGDETAYCLVETITNLDDVCYDAALGTRATPAYTENFDALYGNDLYVTAFEPKSDNVQLTNIWGGFYGDENGAVKYNKDGNNTYSFNYSSGAQNIHWPGEEGEKPLWFFLQAPYKAATSALKPTFYNNGSIQFDYTSPKLAPAQKDILFSSKSLTKDTKDSDNHILMYHALTGVKFKVDPALGLKKDAAQVVITKVTLKDINSKGHCTITPNYTDDNTSAKSNKSNVSGSDDSKSATCSKWTAQNTPAPFTITPSAEYADASKSNYDYADSFYAGNTAVGNLNNDDFTNTFFLIPQDVTGKEIEVECYYIDKATKVKKTFTRTVKFPAETVWMAGELRTYTLTVNVVDVDITDKVNDLGAVKSDVVIKNTGNVKAYIRAAVASAWYYYGPESVLTIVAPYEGDGVFVGFDSADWIKYEEVAKDGKPGDIENSVYYYYKYPVEAGMETGSKLFTSFDASTAICPFEGAHLEMKVLVQAVQYDENKQRVGMAWPADVVSQLAKESKK